MIPILSTTIVPVGNGIGGLGDAIECKVSHEINGEYELIMRYPINGMHFDELETGLIIVAQPGILDTSQPFRIYRITKPLNGVVTIYAHHVVYDMSGIVVTPFTASSLANAITAVSSHVVPSMSGFTLATDKTVNSQMTIVEPRPLWRLLGGQEGSFLDVYGGEWDFNGQTATLKSRIGADNGVEVWYGKNLTGFEQDETLEGTYGYVYPYWYDEESGTLVTLTEQYIAITGALSDRILCLDCGDHFEDQPTETQLRNYTNSYITANSIGNADFSWKVDFLMLAQTLEYKNQAHLEQVSLGDTIHVTYDALGVNITARIVKTEYDVLRDQYVTLTVGRVKQNLAAIVTNQSKEIENLKKALTNVITANSFRAGTGAKAVLDSDSLDFFNSSGTLLQSYPASGYPWKDLASNGEETSNLNNCTDSGRYTYNSAASNVPSAAGGVLDVVYNTATYMYQLAYVNVAANDDSVAIRIRKHNSNGWYAWQKVLTSGNDVVEMSGNLSELHSTSGTTKTYSLANGTYLVTTTRVNSTLTTQDGVWFVQSHTTSSHLTALLAPSGTTTVSINAGTLTLTTGSNNVRITITKLS